MTTVAHPAPDVETGAVIADGSASRRSPSSASWRLPAAAVLVLSAVVSFVSVGRASFSLDESLSTTLAESSWHGFTQSVLHREANMSLYYLLLRLWMHLGHSEAVVRSLSVVASVGALAVIMVVTRRLFDRRTALICGLLLAADPLVVMFAQDARGYALSLLLVCASSALFVRGLQAPSGWSVWFAYAVVSALAAYANFWAALVPLAHGASLAFLPPGSAPWRRLIPTGIGLGILLVPLAALIHATDSSGVNWAAGSSAGRVFTTVRSDIPHPVIDLAAVLVVVIVVALVAVVRRHPKTQSVLRHWPVAFAVCWLVVPVAAVVLLSLVYKPLLVVRYLVICLPPFVMLVSYGLARLRGRLSLTAVAALVVVSGVGLGALFAHGSSQNWRGAVGSVARRAQPGDGVVVFAPYTRIPFQWYIRQHPAAEADLHPVYPAGAWATDGLRYDASIGLSRSSIETTVAGYRRIWLVLSQQQLYPSQDQALLAGLRSAGLAPVNTRTFAGVQVIEYAGP
jgi:mannosyltransferase